MHKCFHLCSFTMVSYDYQKNEKLIINTLKNLNLLLPMSPQQICRVMLLFKATWRQNNTLQIHRNGKDHISYLCRLEYDSHCPIFQHTTVTDFVFIRVKSPSRPTLTGNQSTSGKQRQGALHQSRVQVWSNKPRTVSALRIHQDPNSFSIVEKKKAKIQAKHITHIHQYRAIHHSLSARPEYIRPKFVVITSRDKNLNSGLCTTTHGNTAFITPARK